MTATGKSENAVIFRCKHKNSLQVSDRIHDHYIVDDEAADTTSSHDLPRTA